MEELLQKMLIISLVCVGLRFVSSKEMIFYFLRMPYEWFQSEEKESVRTKSIITAKIFIYILKPLIGCVTCMASVYTIAIDWLYYGRCDRYTLILIFMVACINTLLYSTFEKLTK